jgi:hypothetical protein
VTAAIYGSGSSMSREKRSRPCVVAGGGAGSEVDLAAAAEPHMIASRQLRVPHAGDGSACPW